MEDVDKDTCMDCGTDLRGKKRYPVYSARLKVIGYRCEQCHERSKSPATKRREEEMSRLMKDVPKLENPNMDIRRSLKKA